jgi:hypothetical protein
VPSEDDIDTTDVENLNSIIRERLGRFVRRTKCFSKIPQKPACSVSLFQFYWDFINNTVRGKSPGVAEGLTDHLWTWQEFLHKTLTIVN